MDEATEQKFRDHISYCKYSGRFVVLKPYGSHTKGKVPGALTSRGYRTITFNGRTYQEHHVAWFLTYGVWPTGQIDHINGVRYDNRISNLRQVSPAENYKNRRRMKNNTSGIQGVYYHKRDQNWKASIRANGKNVHLGYFDTVEAAARARKAAEQVFGYHENHGSSVD